MASTVQTSSSSNDLRRKVVNEGVEGRVEVNQRMLIDNMLARYSSDFAVFRELVQNSDDARATSFCLEIVCDPSSDLPNVEHKNASQSTNMPGHTGNVYRKGRRSAKVSPQSEDGGSADHSITKTSMDTSPSSAAAESVFHNSKIIEIRAINNGQTFTEIDWKRVATIAEGNTDVDAIGQFGVGFFSVFSYSDQPLIKSGKECMAFVWKDGKSLTTFRKELSIEEQSQTTSVILSIGNKYILQTESAPDVDLTMTNENQDKKTKVIPQNRKPNNNVTINEVVPTIKLSDLKAYFIKGT
jgi:hypothetical protein